MAIRMPEKDARRLQGAQRSQGRSIFDEEESDQDAPGGVFDVEDLELGKAPTGELDVVPGRQQDLPQAAKDAMMRGGGTLGAVTPDRQPTNQANQPDDEGGGGDEGGGAAPQEPQGMFDDLEDIDTRQERERQAFADELEARRAEAMQQAEARAGLGGMGLSGATAELSADIGRQEARAGDIAMADLGRRQQQETFDELRRQASIWAFEEEFGTDLDGDGSEGNPEAAGEVEEFSVDMTAEQAARGGIQPYGTKPPENSTLVERGQPGTYDTYRTDDGKVYYIENKPYENTVESQLRQVQRGEA